MVRRTLYVITVLWVIAVLALVYVYYGRNFTQYLDTVQPETTEVQDDGSAPTSEVPVKPEK